jgi:hypothetical protein
VTALSHLDAAGELLEDFLHALQLAVAEYRDGDRETEQVFTSTTWLMLCRSPIGAQTASCSSYLPDIDL